MWLIQFNPWTKPNGNQKPKCQNKIFLYAANEIHQIIAWPGGGGRHNLIYIIKRI